MFNTTQINSPIRKLTFRSWGFVFIIAAYSYLIYKLATFDHYSELLQQWKQMPLSQFRWLAGVLFLLPFNWLFESVKWKMMTSHLQPMTFKNSIKAVLVGISTGFFTPNRVGELVGRIMFLNSENRKSGITLSILNSLTQNLILALCGIPACILFFNSTNGKIETNIAQYLVILGVCLVIFGMGFFSLPLLTKRFKQGRYFLKIKEFTDCLSAFTVKDLAQIMLVSFIRYVVFCTQFFLMLRFFGIELSGWQAFISIPTSYLLVTFTPSFAFSEVAVRSSIAVLIIGTFSNQVVNIALAGMGIWLVNFMIPMLIGSVMMVEKQK